MSRFIDLNEQDRIQYVKDGFVLILEQLAKDPSKLSNYIKLEAPKLTVAALETIKETMTDDEKAAITTRNTAVKTKVDAENEKLTIEYEAKKTAFNKVEEIVSKLQKKEGCNCGTCLNLNITNGIIPPELDTLIDAARKEAEERNY